MTETLNSKQENSHQAIELIQSYWVIINFDLSLGYCFVRFT
jgi:hypothetical protein